VLPKIGKDHLVPEAIIRARLFAVFKNSRQWEPAKHSPMGTLLGFGAPLFSYPPLDEGNVIGHPSGDRDRRASIELWWGADRSIDSGVPFGSVGRVLLGRSAPAPNAFTAVNTDARRH
jgi:hypothetical protein